MIVRVGSTPFRLDPDGYGPRFAVNHGPGRVKINGQLVEPHPSVQVALPNTGPVDFVSELPDHLEGHQATVLIARVPKPTVSELEARIAALEAKGA